MREIMACPFCGGKSEFHMGVTRIWVECTVCGGEGPDQGQNKNQAIKAWNTRAALNAKGALNAKENR